MVRDGELLDEYERLEDILRGGWGCWWGGASAWAYSGGNGAGCTGAGFGGMGCFGPQEGGLRGWELTFDNVKDKLVGWDDGPLVDGRVGVAVHVRSQV